MSWLSKLVETYDLHDGNAKLAPPFHAEREAHIIVTLREPGRLVAAELIDKKDSPTIIPCTEESASRTSNPEPHPLFDSLKYVAGDLGAWLPEKEAVLRQKVEVRFEKYMKQLDDWCESVYADPYVRIVRDYLKKKRLCEDLIDKKLLLVDERGAIVLKKTKRGENRESADGKRVKENGSLDAVVLFKVEPGNRQPTVCLWESPSVRKSWRDYYSSLLSQDSDRVGFCQLLGKKVPLANLHQRDIRKLGDKAKLISGNDDSNFTYRGRFESVKQAFAVSAEASWKAHSALHWLLAKQGCSHGGQYMVAWAVAEKPEIPSPTENTHELLKNNNPFAEQKEPEIAPDTAEAAAAALNKMINGYKANLETRGLCFMVIDSATQGTLAVKLFRDLECSRYLDNIRHWHSTCAWRQDFGKGERFYGAPAPHEIVHAAYGELKPDSRLKISAITRLLPCILDRALIPRDIADCVMRRASHPEAVKPWEFSKNLSIACSIYRYNNQTRREYTMSLDSKLASRDYLYGRLLAAADYLEYSALTANETRRTTNAMRFMARFAAHPYSTWRNLAIALTPYKARLSVDEPGLSIWLERLIEEIHCLFTVEDFRKDHSLSGEYLLGYYCQKQECFRKENEDSESVENN